MRGFGMKKQMNSINLDKIYFKKILKKNERYSNE